MSKFKNTPVRINIQIEEEIRKQYKKKCIDLDTTLSDRIRLLIIKDINNEIL